MGTICGEDNEKRKTPEDPGDIEQATVWQKWRHSASDWCHDDDEGSEMKMGVKVGMWNLNISIQLVIDRWLQVGEEEEEEEDEGSLALSRCWAALGSSYWSSHHCRSSPGRQCTGWCPTGTTWKTNTSKDQMSAGIHQDFYLTFIFLLLNKYIHI